MLSIACYLESTDRSIELPCNYIASEQLGFYLPIVFTTKHRKRSPDETPVLPRAEVGQIIRVYKGEPQCIIIRLNLSHAFLIKLMLFFEWPYVAGAISFVLRGPRSFSNSYLHHLYPPQKDLTSVSVF